MAQPQEEGMSITVTNVHHTMFLKRNPRRQVWRRAIVVITGLTFTVSLLLWLLYGNKPDQA